MSGVVRTAPRSRGARGAQLSGGPELLSPTEMRVRVATCHWIFVPFKGWRWGKERQLMTPRIWINFSFAFYNIQSASK